MKRIRYCFFVVLLLATTFFYCQSAFAFSGAGTGTAADPFIITTPAQLQEIQDNMAAHYRLANDLDLSGVQFQPLGYVNNKLTPFTGSLDGYGFAIQNLTVNTPQTYYVGLFANIQGATVKNLRMENVELTGHSYVGGIAGYVTLASTSMAVVENCSVSGSINGNQYLGGFVGSAQGNAGNIKFEKVYATTDITCYANAYAGGFLGHLKGNAYIYESYFAGSITSNYGSIGGFIGGTVNSNPAPKVEIINCFVTGDLNAATNTGGFIGSCSITAANLKMQTSYFGGTMTAEEKYRYPLTAPNNVSTSVVFDGEKAGIIELYGSRHSYAMMQKETYDSLNYNFNTIWAINEGESYPYLKSLPKPEKISAQLTAASIREGAGTVANPYVINEPAQIESIAYDLYSHYILNNDIDMANIDFKPIGKASTAPFSGSLDGKGFSIKNLKINEPAGNYVGFFRQLNNASISNLTFENADITGMSNVGVLAGDVVGGNSTSLHSTFENIGVTGKVTGITNVGSLIGNAQGDKGHLYLTKVYSSADITIEAGKGIGGGLVGYVKGIMQLNQCYFGGSIYNNGNYYIGGLIGAVLASNPAPGITLNDCFMVGDLSTSRTVNMGGLIGSYGAPANNLSINRCYVGGRLTVEDNKYKYPIAFSATYINNGAVPFDGVKLGLSEAPGAKHPSAMMKQATFTNFDFTGVWAIDEGESYPYLQSLPKPERAKADDTEGGMTGAGTESDPYLVYSPAHLSMIAYDLAGYYRLENDIDMAGINFTPLGKFNTAPFTGSLDGNGHSITNLKVNEPSTNYVGFFRQVNRAKIKNINFIDVDITGNQYVGGIAGDSLGINSAIYTAIENVGVTGKVNGARYVGGLIGYGQGDKGPLHFNKVYSSTEVIITGGYHAGGFVGESKGTLSFTECYFDGTVNATNAHVGGFIGNTVVTGSTPYITINDSFVTGELQTSGIARAGGFIANFSAAANYLNINRAYFGGKLITTDNKNGYPIDAPNNNINTAIFDGYAAGIKNMYYSKNPMAMRDSRTYTALNYDFREIWVIDEGASYPYLKSLPKPAGVTGNTPENTMGGGLGTVDNPYIIKEPRHLEFMAYDLFASYALDSDIDMAGIEFEPIGTNTVPFVGNLDGKGNSIKNLTINKPSQNYVGLFGALRQPTIKDLYITNAHITGNQYVGAVAGALDKTGGGARIVENVGITGKITGNVNVGSVFGFSNGTSNPSYQLMKVYSTADISCTGNGPAGGLVGQANGTMTLNECYFAGNINSTNATIGGLVGMLKKNGNTISLAVNNCFVDSNMESNGIVSGFVGSNAGLASNLYISSSYFTGTLSETSRYRNPMVYNNVFGIISAVYFNSDTTGMTTQVVRAEPKTTAEMMQQSTYYNWDFDTIWRIEEGSSFPYLGNTPIPKNDALNISGFQCVAATSTQIHLSWNENPSAQLYEIVVDDTPYITADTEIIIDQLLPETTYTIKARSKRGLEYSEWTTPLQIATTEATLGIPQELQCTGATLFTASLTWRPVADAEGYQVFYGDQIVDTDTNACTLTGLLPQSDYMVYVAAVNQYTTGGKSEGLKVTTLPIEIAREFAANQVTYKSISLSWESLAGAVGYELLQDHTIIGVEKTAIVLNDLQPHTTYTFKLRGVNGDVQGGWSEELNITTDPAILETPKNIGVTAKTATTLSIKWDKVPEADSYTILWDDKEQTAGAPQYTINGLSPDTAYTIGIQANNHYAASELGSVTARTDRMAAVTNITTTGASYTSITLSWDSVAGANRYIVLCNSEEHETNTNSITIDGLSPDTSYTIKICARDDNSQGYWSSDYTSRTNTPDLAAPVSLQAEEILSHSVKLIWDAVPEAAHYIIRFGSEEKRAETTTYTVEGLTPYTEYGFRVKAVNEFIEGPWSSGLDVRTLPIPLDDVTNLICTEKTYHSVNLSWSPVQGATHYEVTYGDLSQVVEGTSAFIDDLQPETAYTFKVRGYNSYTSSSYTELTVTTEKANLPYPGGFTVTDRTKNTISLSWDGVAEAEEYEVAYNGLTARTTSTQITLQNLNLDTLYTITVKSRNRYVASPESPALEAWTYPEPFQAVQGLKYTSRSNGAVSLEWQAISGAESYELQWGENTLNTVNTSIIISNLSPSTAYTFKVRALSQRNVGNWASITVTTLVSDAAIYDEISFATKAGQTYELAFSGEFIPDLGNKVFIIEYDPAQLTLIDFAAQTPALDKKVGKIEGTDIEIIALRSGAIEFKINRTVPENNVWTGIFTIVKFKANTNGTAVINFVE